MSFREENKKSSEQMTLPFQSEEETQSRKITTDIHRLLFTVLLGSAMNFREMYFREDIEEMKKSSAPSVEALRTSSAKHLTQKKVNKVHNEQIKKFELGVKSLNDRIYRDINSIKERAGEEKAKMIDSLIDHFTICAEEIISAKDMRQTALVLKLNNQGFFQNIFNELEKEKDGNKEKETEPHKEADTDI